MYDAVRVALLTVSQRAGASDPALACGAARAVGGVPDLEGLEVAAVRLRVADALDDRELTAPEGLPQAHERRVQAAVVVEPQDLVRADARLLARAAVGVIAEGHDGREAVVAAGQLQEHQGARALGCTGARERVAPEHAQAAQRAGGA